MKFAAPLVLALSLSAPPALAAPFPCPPGWSGTPSGQMVAECIAPGLPGLIEVKSYVSVADTPLAQALDGYERLIAADGTPLHERLSEAMGALAGGPALVREYRGEGRDGAYRIRLMLARRDGRDYMLRALWRDAHDSIMAPLISTAIAGWTQP